MFKRKSIFRTALWVIIDLFVLILILLTTSIEIRAADCSGTMPLKFVWTAASGDVDHYNVYVSTDGGGYKLEGITYEPTYTITGANGHSYKMQVEASDAAGNVGPMSEESDIVICDMCPPDAVTNLVASNPIANSITLTWTASGDDGNTGTASEYDIRYSTSTITDSSWDSATQVIGEPAPQAAGSAESFVVSGLASGTTYYFAIMTADEVPNWSGLSNVTTGTALDVTSPDAVTNLIASNPTANSITLTWTASGDDGNTGTASEYDIRYSTSTITDSSWDSATQVIGEPAPQAAGSAESFVVSGLASGTTYYFAIMTADEVPNWSGLSNVVASETLLVDVTLMSQLFTSQNRFDKNTNQFSMIAKWKNIGADQFSEPLQMVIESITPPTVTVANEDGTTHAGKPYYDYSNFVGDGRLEPEETSEAKQLVFNSPGRVKFEFDVSCCVKMGGDTASPRMKLLIGQAKRIHIVIPAVSALAQNFPNPFNPETWIPYELAESSEIRISIYDVQGKLVRTLYFGRKEIGQYFSKDKAAYWDGRNNLGENTGSGVYFYQIQAGDFQAVRKMVIVK